MTHTRYAVAVLLAYGFALGAAHAQYVETSVASFSTANAAWTKVPGGTLAFTPSAVGENWILLFDAQLRSTVTVDQAAEVRYLVNGVEHGFGGVVTPAASSRGPWQHFYRITGTTALQSVEVEIRDGSASGATTTIESLHIIAWLYPTGAGGDVQYVETEGLQAVTAGSWSDYQTLTFTPVGGIACRGYVMMALGNAENADVRFSHPSSGFWPSATGPGHWVNPGFSRETFFVLRDNGLNSGAQTFRLQANGRAGGGNLRYARILAFRSSPITFCGGVVENSLSSNDFTESMTNATTPQLKANLSVGAPPGPRDFLVLQNLLVRGSADPYERRSAFSTAGTVTDGFSRILSDGARSHDQFFESRTAFDMLTSAVGFDLETTFSTSNASFSTSVKESYQVAIQLPTATGPLLVTTNYRSIGTAPDTNAGTVTAVNGSPIVTGAATTWVSDNRGRGDRIQIDGVDYTVLAVDSQTQLTLTGPFGGATGAGKAYLIARQFTLLADWEDCTDGPPGTACPFFPVASASLVADNRREVGIVYNDSDFTGDILFDGATTDPTHTITLTADDGNRHYGLPGQGVVLDASASLIDPVRVREDFVTVEWLEIFGGADPGVDGVHLQNQTNGANKIVLRNLLIHDVPQYGINNNSADMIADIYNNVVYNASRGIRINGTLVANASVRILNNTVFNSASIGAISSAGGASVILLQNNIATTGPADVYLVTNLDGNSRNNLASDGSGTTHSPLGGGQDGVSLAAVSFVNSGAGNLHVNPASVAVNAGFDLSSVVYFDIDGGARQTLWDVGADDVAATTEVELVFFSAKGLDSAVELSWETATELDNLGFHVYRATSAEGPYVRISERLIPGLGSSPVGASYHYRDSGVLNGEIYYYELEDVETTGSRTRHGPVDATPSAQAGWAPAPPTIVYGRPSSNTLQVRSEGEGAVIELLTSGFFAELRDDGTIAIGAPGLEGSPLPVTRPWIDSLEGRAVAIVSIETSPPERFQGLSLEAAAQEIAASANGVVRIRGRRAPTNGETPAKAAKVLKVGYQGQQKRVQLELAPLRLDPVSGDLLLTPRIVVRLRFLREKPARPPLTARARSRSVLARLAVRTEGLQAVAYRDVFGVGSRRSYSARAFRLSRHRESVPFHVEPQADRFGPGSTLFFVSAGARANPYGAEAVYELERGDGTMMRLSTPQGPSDGAYWRRLELEENRYYQAGLVDAPDLWLWDLLLAPAQKAVSLDVTSLAASAGGARLSVWLQGVSDFTSVRDHHVRVHLNGSFLDERFWDGKEALHIDADVAAGALVEGKNLLEIENVGDTGAPYSMVMLDRVSLEYPAAYHGSFAVDTSGADPVWVRGEPEGRAVHLVASPEEIGRPEIRRGAARSLRVPRKGASYLALGPAEFLETARPLLDRRRREGLSVAAVALEDVYATFGFGENRPEAIRDFLRHVYHDWPDPELRYVLLLGDGTYDFKDYLGTGVVNRVPPLIVRTSVLWTASDPAYASVNGDDLLPDVAIGRLPARNREELRTLIEKTLAYEVGPHEESPLVLVTDEPDDAGDFVSDASALVREVLAGRNVETIHLSELGAAATREAIRERLDAGASLLSYLGHGGIQLWSKNNVFDASAVSALSPQPNQPILVTLNCLNGYFHFPYFDSLAEVLLKAEGKGVIAAFSPSGLSSNQPADRFHRALLEAVLEGDHERLGDAVLAAQRDYAATGALPELLSIYHLFGDPALRIR